MHSQILKKIKNECRYIATLKDYDEILNEIECKVNDKKYDIYIYIIYIYISAKDIKDLVIYCKRKIHIIGFLEKNEFIKGEYKKIRIIIKTILKNYKKNCQLLYDKMYKCENIVFSFYRKNKEIRNNKDEQIKILFFT